MANKEKNPCKTTTRPGRLSYCYIYEPAPTKHLPNWDPDKAAKYSTHLLIPKEDTKAVQILMLAMEAAVKDAVQNYAPWGGKLPKTIKYPLQDGNDFIDTNGEIYEGHFFLKTSNIRKPLIVDRDRVELDEEGEVYSGCYARLSVEFFPYSNADKGLTCRLLAVQKWEDGEPLSGSVGSADDFADPDDDDEDMGDLPFTVPGETEEEARAAEKAARQTKKQQAPKKSSLDDLLGKMNFGGDEENYAA